MIIVSRTGGRRFAFTARRLPREYESGVGPLEFAALSVIGGHAPPKLTTRGIPAGNFMAVQVRRHAVFRPTESLDTAGYVR
jgi:hypothetical protein